MLFDSTWASRLEERISIINIFSLLSLLFSLLLRTSQCFVPQAGPPVEENAFLHREFCLYLLHYGCDSSTSVSKCNFSKFLSRFLRRSVRFYFRIFFLNCSCSVSICSLRVSGFRTGNFIGASFLVQC